MLAQYRPCYWNGEMNSKIVARRTTRKKITEKGTGSDPQGRAIPENASADLLISRFRNHIAATIGLVLFIFLAYGYSFVPGSLSSKTLESTAISHCISDFRIMCYFTTLYFFSDTRRSSLSLQRVRTFFRRRLLLMVPYWWTLLGEPERSTC